MAFGSLTLYMYGAMLLKYVAGSKSMVEAVSFLVCDLEQPHCLVENLPIDPYIFGIFIFGFFALAFSFGNIENSKYL